MLVGHRVHVHALWLFMCAAARKCSWLVPVHSLCREPLLAVDFEDEEAVWSAIQALPLLELVELRQFLLCQVRLRS